MASVNFAKMNLAKAAGLRVHLDTNERENRDHSNKHINKELSHLNSFYGADSYDDMLQRVKARIKQADEEHPPQRVKKDRVTVISAEFKCPHELVNQGKAEEFLQRVYDTLKERYGTENMCGMTIHKDEVHEYLDSKTNEMKLSLPHAHAFVVPYAHWTDKKGIEHEGINCTHFMTRTELQEMQKAVNEMCVREYGIAYNTKEEPRHMSVEQLKADSDRAEEVIERAQQYADQVNDHTEYLELEKDNLETTVSSLEMQKGIADNELLEVRRELSDVQEALSERSGALNRTNTQLQHGKARLERIGHELERIEHDIEERELVLEHPVQECIKEINRLKAQLTNDPIKSPILKGISDSLFHDEDMLLQIYQRAIDIAKQRLEFQQYLSSKEEALKEMGSEATRDVLSDKQRTRTRQRDYEPSLFDER